MTMVEIVKKGTIGQTSMAIIAVVLVLQVVMPYVKSDDGQGNEPVTDAQVSQALEPIKGAVRDLSELNRTQCKADEAMQGADAAQAKALTQLSHQMELTARAMLTMQRQLERLNP